LALIEEGDMAPTAERMSQRAGVSLRTVFHQFEDLATIHHLAGERLFDRVKQIPAPAATDRSVKERVDAFVRYRVAVYDVLHPLSSAARVREPFSPALRANRDQMLQFGRDNVRLTFQPELAVLKATQAERVVAGIGLATNWSAWYALLEELQQERSEAIIVMRAVTRAVLAGSQQFG